MSMILKNWRIPAIILMLLVLAMAFRWDNIGSTTKDGVITKTSKDRWNGAVWQETIRNGSYSERIIQPSWLEAMRKPIEKEVEYQEAVYSDDETSPFNDKTSSLYGKTFSYVNKKVTYVTKTKIVQVPPDPIYWLSRNGLTKIWVYVTIVTGIWFISTLIIKKKKVESSPTVDI